jgi:hypothetical protein
MKRKAVRRRYSSLYAQYKEGSQAGEDFPSLSRVHHLATAYCLDQRSDPSPLIVTPAVCLAVALRGQARKQEAKGREAQKKALKIKSREALCSNIILTAGAVKRSAQSCHPSVDIKYYLHTDERVIRYLGLKLPN